MTPLTDDEAAHSLLRAHLTWMYDLVLRETIPEKEGDATFVDCVCKVCWVLETEPEGSVVEDAGLVALLTEGKMYSFVSRIVFEGEPVPLSELSERAGTSLQDLHRTPLCVSSHNALSEHLLKEYCSAFLDPREILQHVSSFCDRKPPVDRSLEQTLLFWLCSASSLFGETTFEAGAPLHACLHDGRLIALCLYKYDTSFVPLDKLHLGHELSPELMKQNWELVGAACRRSKVSLPFLPDIAVACPETLRWHFLWLVQMCFLVLKKSCDGVLGCGPFLGSGEESRGGGEGKYRRGLFSPVCTRNGEGAREEGEEAKQKDEEEEEEDDDLPPEPSTPPVPSCFYFDRYAGTEEEEEEGWQEDTSLFRKQLVKTSCTIERSGADDPLGVELSPDCHSPPYVRCVSPASPADRAGLRPGMLILSVDGTPVPTCLLLAKSLVGRTSCEVVTAALQDTPISFVAESIKLKSPYTGVPKRISGARPVSPTRWEDTTTPKVRCVRVAEAARKEPVRRPPPPLTRCNVRQVLNAIRHVCLPGQVNATNREQVCCAVQAEEAQHYILVLKATTQPLLRAVYSCSIHSPRREYKRIWGVGSRVLAAGGLQCLRYDCGVKVFTVLPSSFDVYDARVDAVARCKQMVQAP